jgi:DNA-directed RNA polymerase subunit RPC12/RpoP
VSNEIDAESQPAPTADEATAAPTADEASTTDEANTADDASAAPTADDASAASERRFPCGQCGAALTFAPGTQTLTCGYCGFQNPIPQSQVAVEEANYARALEELASHAETVEARTLKCTACGADVDLPGQTMALPCPFCGSDLVATATSCRRIKPGALLPFKVPGEQAWGLFRGWLLSRWFAPAKMRHAADHPERLRGMYVPHWTYDCRTTSRYSGMRGDHYMVTVGTGKNRRTVMHTRWRPASGVVESRFDDVLIVASHSLPPHAAELVPWDLKQLVPYADEYLSGFGSESYQVDLPAGFDLARSIMDERIAELVRRDIGGDVQQIHDVQTRYDDLTYKHILLPIWISAYRFRQRVYRFLVNARTGEVQGERPWSWWKISGTVLAAAGLVAALVLFLQASQAE